MDNKKWNNVLLEWVNCLKLCKPITNIDELRSGEFFRNLGKVITKSREVQCDVLTFVFDLLTKHYPNFKIENKTEIHLTDLPEPDLKAVISLLMHYTCIYDRRDVLTSPLCHSLSQSTQLIVRNFLEKISHSLNNDTMNDIIKICIDDASDHLSHQWLSAETLSNRNSPLQDLLKTPVAKFGRLQEKDRIIARLKSDLETERYDKADLQEELKQQQEKIKKIEQQLAQKSNEITRLRTEVVALENRTPPHYQDMDSRELQKRLRSEIKSLEHYIKQIEEEEDEIRKEKDVTKEHLRKTQLQSSIWEEKFFEIDRSFESLTEHSKKQEEELKELRTHCSELTAMLEEYRAKPANDSSLFDTLTSISEAKALNETPCYEDLACSVVEVQLRDAQKQNEELRRQIEQVQEAANAVTMLFEGLKIKLEKVESCKEELEVKVSSFELEKQTTHKQLCEMENNLEEANKKSQQMETEMENLVAKLQESNETLQEFKNTNEELLLKVNSLQADKENVQKQLSEMSNDWDLDNQHFQDVKKISEKLQFELGDAVLENYKINAQFNQLRTDNQVLYIKLQEVEEARNGVKTHLIKYQMLAEELRAKLAEGQFENQRINEELVENKTQLIKLEEEKSILELTLQKSQEKFDILEKTNEKFYSEINTLHTQLNDALTSLDVSQKESQKLEKGQTLLEKQLIEMQTHSENLRSELGEFQSENQRINLALDDNKAQLVKLEEEKTTILLTLESSTEKLDNFEQLNKQLNSEKTSIEKQLYQALNQLDLNENNLKQLKEIQTSLEEQLKETKADSEKVKTELDKCRVENENINKELDENKAQLTKFEEENSMLLFSVRESAEKRDTLEKCIHELKSESSKIQEQLTQTLDCLESSKKNSQKLEDERNALEQQLNDSEKLRSELDLLHQKMEEELKENVVQLTKIEEEKLALILKLQKSEEGIEALQLKLQESENACDDLTKKNKEFFAQNEVIQKQLSEALDSLKASNNQSEKLQEVQISLQAQLLDTRTCSEKLQTKLEHSQCENRQIKEALDVTETKLQLSEEKCCNSQQKNEDLQLEIQSLQTKLSDVEKILILSKENADDLKRIQDGLEIELCKLGEEKESLLTKLTQADEKLEDLQKHLHKSRDSLDLSKKEADELRASQEKLELRLNESEIHSNQLEADIDKLTLENCEAKKNLTESRFNSHKLQKEKTVLIEKLDALDKEKTQLLLQTEDLRCQLSETQNNNKSVKNHSKQLQSTIDLLETRLQQIQFQLKETQDETDVLQKMTDELEDAQSVLEMKLCDAENCSSVLRQELQMQEIENQAINEELSRTEKRCLELQNHNEDLSTQLKQLEVQNKGLLRAEEDLQKQLSQSKNIVKETRQMNEKLEVRLSEMSDCLEKAEIGKLKANETLMNAKNENQVLMARNVEVERSRADLGQKFAQLVTDLEINEEELESTKAVRVSLESAVRKLEAELKNKNLQTVRFIDSETKRMELEQEKAILTSTLTELKKKNEDLVGRNEILQGQLEDSTFSKNETELLLESNIKYSNVLEEKEDELEEKMKGLNKVIQKLVAQNEDAQSQVNSLEKSYKQLKHDKEIVGKQLDEMSSLSEALKGEAEELRVQYQKSKVELDEMRDALLKLTFEKENAASLLEEAIKKHSEASNELQLSKQKSNELERQLMELNEALIALQIENKKLICQNGNLEKRINEVETNSKENEKALEGEVDKLSKVQLSCKEELAAAAKRVEEAEQGLEDSKQEVLLLNGKLERMADEKLILEKKIEVDEFVASETREKIKLLEDTVQDYEITISGLKSVVDTNLESLEALKHEISNRESQEADTIRTICELLKDFNVVCEEEGQGDFKTFISEKFRKILNDKSRDNQQKLDLESEIEDLKTKNMTANKLNSSFKEMIEKLQVLVMEQTEVGSLDVLKASFDKIHTKVNNVMQIKQKLEDDLQKLENDKSELDKKLQTVKAEKDEVCKSKTELENALTEEKAKVENLRKELEAKSRPIKAEKENILGVSTKSNKSREEELKKENMMLRRKIVLAENSKNNIEKVLKELREEKKKTRELPSSPTNDALYKKLLQEYIQVKEENERVVKEKDAKYEQLSRENEALKMGNLPINEDDKKVLKNIREAYGNVMSANSKLELEIVTLRKVIEERNTEVASLAHIKEAYERLLEENNKVLTEIDTIKYKRTRDKEEFVRLIKKDREETANRETKKIQDIRNEYESKLEKMKEKMLKLYRDEVNKKVKSVKDGQSETTNLMRTVANLQSELFEADQRIQLLEMERDILKTNSDSRTVKLQSISSVTSVTRNEDKAATLPRPSITEEITISRRTSIGGLPNSMGAASLQMEDEEDLFNDKYLTDLKEGRCIVPVDRESTSTRFSELAWRNSMVPPHLKSSYPAELQFVSPGRFKDEDIKTGNIEFEDSLCKLLPGEKPRKKDFGTTSYKKPGPPTPSKNGGRLSLQGNEVHPLREHSEAKTPKKSTPSRIKALFTGRNSSTRDESHNTTPSRGRRLNIFRRPR